MPIEIRPVARLVEGIISMRTLGDLEPFYPGFRSWFLDKALPDALLPDHALVHERGRGGMSIAIDDGNVIGCALWRRGPDERKLRCVRVIPSMRGRGVALRLIDDSLRRLNDDAPACTVAEELIHDYARILVNRYGFRLSDVTKGEYRPGKLEYRFNVAPNEIAKPSPY
jgi:predicted GNAT family acetyltransferase